jgi:anti-sigma-K factor RskA
MNRTDSMNRHPQREEEFELYALGLLEGEERSRMEAHASDCPECAGKVAEALGRTAMIALAAPQQSPPESMKQRLMERVHPTARLQPARAVEPEGSPGRNWWAAALAPLALGLAAATVLLWIANSRMNRDLAEMRGQIQQEEAISQRNAALVKLFTAPDSLKVNLAPAEGTEGRGEVRYNARESSLFYAGNLPVLPADRAYELWVIPAEGQPIAAGVFTPDAAGNCSVVLPPLQSGITAKAFAVTVEAAGGAGAPTTKPIQVGAVS